MAQNQLQNIITKLDEITQKLDLIIQLLTPSIFETKMNTRAIEKKAERLTSRTNVQNNATHKNVSNETDDATAQKETEKRGSRGSDIGMEELLTVEELAAYLKVHESRIYQWTREKGSNAIPNIKTGKYYRFRVSDVIPWIEKRYKKDSQ